MERTDRLDPLLVAITLRYGRKQNASGFDLVEIVLLETVSPDDTVGLNMGCHGLDPEIPERGIPGELTQSYE
jgi:hypothetical protein